MERSIETVGIIGFGAMGQFMAKTMFDGLKVVGHDPNINQAQVNDFELVSLPEAVSSDAVILATPASTLETVTDEVTRLDEFSPGTLLVDVCSVKEWPTRVFDRLLPNHPQVLHCHPLFGPQSGRKTLKGHRLFVTESSGNKAAELVDRWLGLGLKLIETTAEEHDKLMVGIQAAPFIMGRIANRLDLDDPISLQTPSRLSLRKLQWIDDQQSEELFRTMVEFNPHVEKLLSLILGVALDLQLGQEATYGRQQLVEENRYMPARP